MTSRDGQRAVLQQVRLISRVTLIPQMPQLHSMLFGMKPITIFPSQISPCRTAIRISMGKSQSTVKPRVCKYIDDYHLLVGSNAYHICEFAERTRANGISVVPFPEKRVIWSNIDLDTSYELWKELHSRPSRKKGCLQEIPDKLKKGEYVMPRKIDLITELYRRTVNNITSDSGAWRAFLTSAAYQYKYSFADQVLIHAQRPRATACAELELWNKHFDRWVKRGATGIALIAGNPNGGKMYLNHVFDVADTHHREDKPFKLWSVSPSLEEDVVEALENRFGDLGNKDSFTDAVISTCINLGQDNLQDYLRELEYSAEGSFLEELDEDNLRYRLQLTVQASVAYTVLSRLGYDADVYVGAEAFDWVHEFNTPATVNILGNATGDIAELCLREIERTVKSIERTMQQENRIIDGSAEKGYNDGGKEPTEQNNGGNDNGNHLQNGERREAAESQPAQTDRLPDREVWTDEIEFYEEPSQRDLHDPSDRGQAERSPVRSGADSTESAFGDYVPDGTEPWGDGGTESDRSNEVGSDDEQHQELGGGGTAGDSDLRISDEDGLYAYDGKGVDPKYLDTEISGELPPPSEETLILALRHGDYLHKSKLSIVSFLMTESDPQKKVDYVKKSYEMGLTGEFFRPGTEEHIGYHVEPKGLVIYEGNYLTHKTEAKFSWELVTDLIEALMKEGRYLDDVREGQQLSFMDVMEPAVAPTVEREAPINNHGISQDVIDDFLRVGGCTKESAERIYGFFHRKHNLHRVSKSRSKLLLRNGFGKILPAVNGSAACITISSTAPAPVSSTVLISSSTA